MGFERVSVLACFAAQIWGVMLYSSMLVAGLRSVGSGFGDLAFTGIFAITALLIVFTWLVARRSLMLMLDLASGIPRDVDRLREEGEYRFLLRFATALFALNLFLISANMLIRFGALGTP